MKLDDIKEFSCNCVGVSLAIAIILCCTALTKAALIYILFK